MYIRHTDKVRTAHQSGWVPEPPQRQEYLRKNKYVMISFLKITKFNVICIIVFFFGIIKSIVTVHEFSGISKMYTPRKIKFSSGDALGKYH